MKLIAAAVALSASIFVADAGSAATYSYSYTFSGGDVISGQLDGTVQGDGNKVVVNDVLSVSYNGSASPDFALVDSVTGYALSSPTPATVSFDGAFMDFLACWSLVCDDGFAVKTTGYWGNPPWAASGPSLGTNAEGYVEANWSLVPVPLPATVMLLLSTLAGLFAVGRRRRAA